MSYSVRLILFSGILFLSALISAPASQSSYNPDVIPSIKRILVNGDSVLFISDSSKHQNSEVRQKVVLNFRNNNISLELQPEDSISYQFFLEGFDREWSGWKHVSFKEYTNLPSGNYVFKIRYISSGNSGGEISLLSLRVLPIWYFSWAAIIFYIVAFSIAIWALFNLLNLRFARRLYSLEQS